MHICFLTSEYPKKGHPHGGMGSFVKTIALELIKRNVNVTIIGLNYDFENENIAEDGIKIIRVGKSKVKGLSWFFNAISLNKAIQKVNKENPINIIEASELGLAFIKKRNTIKYIIRLHGGHHFFAEAEKRKINFWKGFQEKKSFRKADAFVAVSNYVKEHTNKYLSFNNKPIQVIYNPINNIFFTPIDVEIEVNNITFLGTVCEKKGVRQLIQAFPYIKEKVPNAVLNIYGRDWFFPDGSSYIAMLKENELTKIKPFDECVFFKGAIPYDTTPIVYSKARVCVFPSHMETLGLVAPEAMSLGKVVVFTKEGPGPEIIKDQINGLLCDPYSPKDIANKVICVFEDCELSNKLGTRAKIDITHQFNMANLVSENIQYYNNILNK